jgi:hypothetical protein
MAYKYCQHVRENGIFCASGAVKGRAYCYFHLRTRAQRLAMAKAQSHHEPWRLELPPLEDMHSVQVALMQVAGALGQDLIEPRRAGLLLYALQQAATNLQNKLAWVNGSPFENKVQKEGVVTQYPGLEAEFGLPADINLRLPPYRVFPPPQPSIGEMSEEQWSRFMQRNIEDAIAQAPELKKTVQSIHPQKSSQATTTDNRQLTTVAGR